MDWSGRERDKLFLNDGSAGFVDASYLGGVDNAQDGRAFAFTDLDHDGATDIIEVNRDAPILSIFRNRMDQGNWISLHLMGNGRRTNRDGVGARVTATCGDRSIIRTLDLGTGFGVQNTMTLTIGLGDCTRVDRLLVEWPGSQPQEFSNLQSRQYYKIVQGKPPEIVPGYYKTSSPNSPASTTTTSK